jgi:hypothetical protein
VVTPGAGRATKIADTCNQNEKGRSIRRLLRNKGLKTNESDVPGPEHRFLSFAGAGPSR